MQKIICKIQKIRLKDKIHFDISVLTELDNITCPRLILQPLLENAIKHGYRIGHTLQILVQVKDSDISSTYPTVLIEIHDNGNGITPEVLNKINYDLEQEKHDTDYHVGLYNVNNRLITFFGSREGKIIIKSIPQKGTIISFHLKRRI